MKQLLVSLLLKSFVFVSVQSIISTRSTTYALIVPQYSSIQQQHHNQQQYGSFIHIPNSYNTAKKCTVLLSKKDNNVESKDTTSTVVSSGIKSDSGINFSLIIQNIANQALIGSTIWTGGIGYNVLINHIDISVVTVVLGIVSVVPMLLLSRMIESSESYIVSGLNLSTNMAVLRLFGSKPKPIVVFVLSLVLATITGIVEETTFRGQLIPIFTSNFSADHNNIVIGAILSILLFAILHTNPLSFITGSKESKLDNFVLLLLQLINGSYFTVLYFISNNNLIIPILTHILYDLYTFYKTHLIDVAGQMQYAVTASSTVSTTSLSTSTGIGILPQYKSQQLVQKYTKERGIQFIQTVQETFFLLDTNQNGTLSRKELRIGLYSYGINLSSQQSIDVLQSADIDQSGEIDLDEFLQYVGPTGSPSKAIRNTLFGPL